MTSLSTDFTKKLATREGWDEERKTNNVNGVRAALTPPGLHITYTRLSAPLFLKIQRAMVTATTVNGQGPVGSDDILSHGPEEDVASLGPQTLKTNLPDIGNFATWSVSSCKYGFNAACLRDSDPNTYWQ